MKCKNCQPTCGSNNPAITQQSVPKIPLPKFDGDGFKWEKFFELSHKRLHIHPISSATKMLYLKANFMEDVEHLRRHLSPTKDNYNNACKIFHDKYDNKIEVVSQREQSLLATTRNAKTGLVLRALETYTMRLMSLSSGLSCQTPPFIWKNKNPEYLTQMYWLAWLNIKRIQ